ncbi:hypothetical protein AB1Y20_002639 [Prymnesium parvum]|uniref:PDEase domain-containing protein n=1 Tax=Prymnesium parvum TaxID=97485 RepID=A0AB34J9W2_PRYPA
MGAGVSRRLWQFRAGKVQPAPGLSEKAQFHVKRALAVLPEAAPGWEELKALEALINSDLLDRSSSSKKARKESAMHVPYEHTEASFQALRIFQDGTLENFNSDVADPPEEITVDPQMERATDGVQEWLLDTLQLRTRRGADSVASDGPSAFELMSYAASRGDVEQLRTLVQEEGVDVNHVSYDQRTAMHVAASEGFLPAVKLLVEELGADASAMDAYGSTPLDDASRAGHDDVVDYLVSINAQRGRLRRLSKLRTSWADSAELCQAAASGDLELLRELVHVHGNNVDDGDYDRRTPLHLAASEGFVDVVKFLVDELGAAVSPFDRWGGTPIDNAASGGYEQIVQFLSERGARHGHTKRASNVEESKSFWMVPEAFDEDDETLVHLDTLAQSTAARLLDSWNKDVFDLQEASGGHALLAVGEALLNRHDLIKHFNLERHTVRRFFLVVERTYGKRGSELFYHNSVHGADVALTMHLFLTKFRQIERLSKVQLLAVIIASLLHDFNHPGTSNAHEVRLATKRARVHSDNAILERHHLHSLYTLLSFPQYDIFAPLSAEDRKTIRALIIDLVLATDLARHVDYVNKLRSMCASQGEAAHRREGKPDVWVSKFHEVDIHFVLQVSIKFADLSHVAKPHDLHRKWTQRITEEFYQIGDRERQLGLPISPLCDRLKDTNVAKSQIGFFRFLCIPFYSAIADLVDPHMLPFSRIKENFRAWQLDCVQHSVNATYEVQEKQRTSFVLRRMATIGTEKPSPLQTPTTPARGPRTQDAQQGDRRPSAPCLTHPTQSNKSSRLSEA